MGITELFLIGVGLSMDAFAVSVCKGLKMRRLNKKNAAVIGLFFGGFQAIMPLIGWLLGKQFEKYITSFDHWIAFVLLAFIGGKMAIEAIKGDDDEQNDDGGNKTSDGEKLDLKELTMLAVATSIDALAVGITFAFLKVNILTAISIIGVTTFVLSIIGVAVGNKFGMKYKSKAEIFGGIVLILIGLKILLEHLGIL
ncbi:MAG: manganese efflux pump MntP family protein [Ruminococcus sp.]|jgi:putative Mn2+ efflux pump MntP|nr:manganese efflux pump MntP family protein [Ruminococcus sp.]